MATLQQRRLILQPSTGITLPYAVSFASLSFFPSGWTAAAGYISGGAALNNPGLGSELLSNGSMETGSPPSNWTSLSGAVLTSASDERTGGSGTKSLQIARNGNTYPEAYQSTSLSNGDWVLMSVWIKRVSASYVSLRIVSSGIIPNSIFLADTNWTQYYIATYMTSTGQVRAGLVASVDAQYGLVDDISLKKYTTFGQLFQGIDSKQVNVTVKSSMTIVPAMAAGTFARLDSFSSPQNFLLALYDRANSFARLIKCVGGTYTSLIATSAIYSAGAYVEIRCSGTDVELYYNNVKIGATQTVSDAGIVSNTNHGIFNPGGGCSCSAFFCS